jgi:agmatinase
MSVRSLLFADADAEAHGAAYVIFGAPYDRTTSFRPGARFAPSAIRQASWNFEQYMSDHGMDFSKAGVADVGDLTDLGDPDEMAKEVESFARRFTSAGKFTILLGGEHSVAPPHVASHSGIDGVVSIDAHLDFRESYHGWANSHACSSRRISEIVGVDRLLPIGIRSMSLEEKEAAEELGLRYVTSYEILEGGIEPVLGRLKGLPWRRIYLTLDIDGIDPAYAPGTGTPEPFGLTPYHVKGIIRALGSRLVGFDVNEVSPPWDHGQTALLAARLVREVVAASQRRGSPASSGQT